jgi:hypothetical protein
MSASAAGRFEQSFVFHMIRDFFLLLVAVAGGGTGDPLRACCSTTSAPPSRLACPARGRAAGQRREVDHAELGRPTGGADRLPDPGPQPRRPGAVDRRATVGSDGRIDEGHRVAWRRRACRRAGRGRAPAGQRGAEGRAVLPGLPREGAGRRRAGHGGTVRSYLARKEAVWWQEVRLTAGALSLKILAHTIVLLLLLKVRMEPLLSLRGTVGGLAKGVMDLSRGPRQDRGRVRRTGAGPEPLPRPLAGHALVEALVAQGVDTAFGVPGESYLAVLDGFHEHRDRIRFVACRQEGGAAFMAEAQGKLSGRPGVCFVTRGPAPPTPASACTRPSRTARRWCCSWARWPATSATARPSRNWTTASSSAPARWAWPSGWPRSRTRPRARVRGAGLPHRDAGPPGPGGAGAARGHADADDRRARAAARRARAGLAGARCAARPARHAAGGAAPDRDRRRQRLGRRGLRRAAALCRELAAAGGLRLPLPGHLRQPPPELRRRRGHRASTRSWRSASARPTW